MLFPRGLPVVPGKTDGFGFLAQVICVVFGLTSMETYDPSLLWNLHWPDNPLCFAKFQDALLICYVESFVVLSLPVDLVLVTQ